MRNRSASAGFWLALFILGFASGLRAQAPSIQSVTPQNTSVGIYDKFEARVALTAAYTNPYDYDDILVKAEFTAPSGKKHVIEGFFQEDYTLNTGTGNITPAGTSGFSIRFSPSEAGNYAYTVTCTNTLGTTTTLPYNFTAVASAFKGFVRKNSSNYLNFDNGDQYVMIGQNLAWQQNNKYLNFKTWTDKLAANNANFIRLWQCGWGLGIEWSGTPYAGLKRYSQVNSFYTDKLLDECKAKDIYMMLCINHHGMVSSAVNPNWNENPYKSTNGGPCVNTWDYFINATAKALHKNRLRYIVARWGYSRNIMSWELFNEVEWTDQYETYKTQIKDWHQEMAQYLKSKDPFGHLLTTSFAHDDKDAATWSLPEMDFTQTHYYNGAANLETVLVGGIASYLSAYNKPTYTGEFGVNANSSNLSSIDPNGTHIHNSVWATLFGGGMGAGSSWWWDTYIEPRNLYTHYKAPALVVAQVPLAAQNYKPFKGSVSGGGASDLVVSPGAGWGKPPAANFTIDASGTITPSASSLSTYMYGSQCKAAEKNAPVFSVTFPSAAQFRVRTGNDISTFCNAQRVQILLNGTEVLNSPATANTTYSINVPAGSHTIKVDNAGGDWYTVASYTFTNMGSPLNTYLLKGADNKRAAGWVHNKKYNWIDVAPGNATPATITGASLTLPGMTGLNYEVKWFECTNGTVLTTTSAVVSGGALTLPVPDVAWDLAFTANEVSTLPIKLSSFSGVYEKHMNRLFITISEARHVKEVWVERSSNGKDFTPIGKLNVVNSRFEGTHQFTDEGRMAGINYYRLYVLDNDGSRQYSKVVVLQADAGKDALLVFPNPAKDQVVISGMLDNPQERYKAFITDVNGRRLFTQSIIPVSRVFRQSFSIEKLKEGCYYFTMVNQAGETILSRLFFKQ